MDGPFWERLSEAMAGQKTTACTRERQAWWGFVERGIQGVDWDFVWPVKTVAESVCK
jgi:hypothetical protein